MQAPALLISVGTSIGRGVPVRQWTGGQCRIGGCVEVVGTKHMESMAGRTGAGDQKALEVLRLGGVVQTGSEIGIRRRGIGACRFEGERQEKDRCQGGKRYAESESVRVTLIGAAWVRRSFHAWVSSLSASSSPFEAGASPRPHVVYRKRAHPGLSR